MSDPCILLQLTHTSLFSYTWKNKRVIQLGQFDPDLPTADDKEQFTAFIRKHKKNSFRVLVEVLEEDFQFDAIPLLSHRDQRVFLSRKLDQIYRHAAYRQATIISKNKKDQHNNVLFSALLHTERIELIVNILLAERCAILGIYSSALTTAHLAKQLNWPAEQVLFLGANAPDSMRYSLFVSGRLHFCRLSIMTPKLSAAVLAEEWASEIRQTWKHLTAENQISRDSLLTIVWPESLESENALFKALEKERLGSHFDLCLMPMKEIAQQLHLPTSCISWREGVLASVICGRIPNHYMPPGIGYYQRLRRIDHLFRWGSMLIPLISFGVGLVLWSQARHLQVQINSAQMTLEQEKKEQVMVRSKEKRGVRVLSPSADHALARFRKRIIQHPDMEQSTQQISQLLLHYPLVRVDRFDWQIHEERGPEPHAVQQIEIAGRMDGEPIQAQEQLEGLLRQLNALSQAEASFVKSPYPSETSISKQRTKRAHPKERPEDFIIQLELSRIVM